MIVELFCFGFSVVFSSSEWLIPRHVSGIGFAENYASMEGIYYVIRQFSCFFLDDVDSGVMMEVELNTLFGPLFSWQRVLDLFMSPWDSVKLASALKIGLLWRSEELTKDSIGETWGMLWEWKIVDTQYCVTSKVQSIKQGNYFLGKLGNWRADFLSLLSKKLELVWISKTALRKVPTDRGDAGVNTNFWSTAYKIPLFHGKEGWTSLIKSTSRFSDSCKYLRETIGDLWTFWCN